MPASLHGPLFPGRDRGRTAVFQSKFERAAAIGGVYRATSVRAAAPARALHVRVRAGLCSCRPRLRPSAPALMH